MISSEVNCTEYLEFLEQIENFGPSYTDTFLEYSDGNLRATEARGNLAFLKEHFYKVRALKLEENT